MKEKEGQRKTARERQREKQQLKDSNRKRKEAGGRRLTGVTQLLELRDKKNGIYITIDIDIQFSPLGRG